MADSILKLNESSAPSPTYVPGKTYVSVARGVPRFRPAQSLLLNVLMVPHQIVLDLHAVEKLLVTTYSCLNLSHVHYINNKVYVTLENDADVAKTAAILNGKPDFQSNFDSASKLNVLYPVKALFVNVSDP